MNTIFNGISVQLGMRYTTFILLISCMVFGISANATKDSLDLSAIESQINRLAQDMLQSKDSLRRVSASDSIHILFEKAYSNPATKKYSFDRLKGVSLIANKDSSVRIFTWQLYHDKDNYSYHGYLQAKDGKVIRLQDESDDMYGVEFLTLKPSYWYGALYYSMRPFTVKGKEYYLLFGYDAFSFFNKRKVLDVLYFDDNGKPKFGFECLQMMDGYRRIRMVHRMLLEYSSSVSVTLNYDEEQNKIIYDHLIQGKPFQNASVTNLPDGSYCGMQWNRKGYWEYIDKVYKDDPKNVLINARTYDEMIKDGQRSKKEDKDIFGNPRKN